MACSNCFNNCVEIVPDKCVKYTGSDIPALGISNGDTLLTIEDSLTTYLLTVLDGTGITLGINPGDVCLLVGQYLPNVNDIKALDLFKALVLAACNIQGQVDTINNTLSVLNADYNVDCLSGVTNSSGTHAVVQAIIVKLCEINTDLAALALDVDTNYVKLANLNALIQAYLDSLAVANSASSKMVPYTVVEYYGPLSNYPSTGDSFDINGAGQNYWNKVYICNGLNGTPDKRGRATVGAIVGAGGGALDTEVDPAADPTFNPNYAVLTKAGINKITLTEGQIPSHTHTVTDPGHTHTYTTKTGTLPQTGSTTQCWVGETSINTGSSFTGISLASTGGGLAHDNKIPVIACHYIMYIP